MKEDKVVPDEFADLRRRAEDAALEALRGQAVNLDELSSEDAQRLFQELQVHKTELELQNEELRRAQQELQASRDRYFDLYDLAPVGYLALNQEGLILEANLTGAALLGVETSRLIEKPFSHFVAPDDRDVFYSHHRQAFEAGGRQACELRMVKGDGAQFHARLEGLVVQDNALRASGDSVNPYLEGASCRVIISDVTARAQAERLLQETNERLNTLLEAIPDIVYFKDAQGRNLAVNKAYEELSGLEREEILGKTDEQLLPPILAAQCRRSDQEAAKGRQPVRVEEQHINMGRVA